MNDNPKNSMNRMDSNTTELILSYLTFEDKIRLECVSKQWQRLIYNKQYVIELDFNCDDRQNSLYRLFDNRRQLNEKHLESVLKKCPNITDVYLWTTVDSEVFSLIGKYCSNIKSLCYFPNIGSDDKVFDFFRTYGHKLEELDLCAEDEDINRFLRFCPNLKKVWISDFDVLNTDNDSKDKEFLPKLEHIIHNCRIHSEDVNKLKTFADKYSQTMKTMNLWFGDMTAEELKTCIDCISRFDNLKSLSLRITSLRNSHSIDDSLSLIGRKCTKLLKLNLRISRRVPITDRFFDALSEFKALKSLEIALPHNTVLNGSVQCFRHCKQLKHLEITYSELTEDFFVGIASFVPNLQTLEISTEKQFSDRFINSFHSMKSIAKVILIIDNEENETIHKKYWYFRKYLSEVMSSPKAKDVIRVNDNCGLVYYQASGMKII